MKPTHEKKSFPSEGTAVTALAIEEESSEARPLALPSMFWRPDYLAPGTSAWVAHTPFAFWVTEAHRPEIFIELGSHYGHSYFAFCQAVERLQLDTRCYAIDTWKGDEHAGFYGEEVWGQVSRYNGAHYAGFSTLIRSTFDEALTHFEEGTVDLLHIDGHHTFESVRRDFETWLPKLSNRGLVLFHDTNVRFGSFGVAKLFSQLKQSYPAFEFHHGHGLGVVGVGADQSAYLRQLFSSSSKPATSASLHRIFSRLGQSCIDLDRSQSAEKQVSHLVEQLNQSDSKVQTLQREIHRLQTDIQSFESSTAELTSRCSSLTEGNEALTAALANAKAHLKNLEARANETAQVSERITELETLNHSLSNDLAALRSHNHAAKSSLEERAEEIASLCDSIIAIEDKLAASQNALNKNSRDNALKRNIDTKRIRTLERALACTKATATASAIAYFKHLRSITSSLEFKIGSLFGFLLGPFSHAQRHKKHLATMRDVISSSGLFDPIFYRSQYPDVAAANTDPLSHFIEYGAAEGRDPSALFDTRGYYLRNRDVVQSGTNPLVHYIKFGKAEGRSSR